MPKNVVKVLEILMKEATGLPMPSVSKIQQELEDPFKVLVSCLLSLRTKDTISYPVSHNLFNAAGTPKKIAEMPLSKLKKIIKPVNYYKTKAERIKQISKQISEDYKNKVPNHFDELMKFKGVGRKTANIVVTYGFGGSTIAVDTHVHRISNRLGWVKTKTPEKTEFALKKIVPEKYWYWVNESLVTHGQNICTPISPFCSKCPVEKYCPKIEVKTSR
ncbi:endonuclease III [Candidatus Woesearchaeota archaeon]|nr:endonuclease III [Candidatus Woesearchaeota archaeon]